MLHPVSAPSEAMVIVRRGASTKRPKLLRQDWSGPYRIKSVKYPRYMFEQESKRKSREPVHLGRLHAVVPVVSITFIKYSLVATTSFVCYLDNRSLLPPEYRFFFYTFVFYF